MTPRFSKPRLKTFIGFEAGSAENVTKFKCNKSIKIYTS